LSVGFDCWLWFAIGGSHVSDRLPVNVMTEEMSLTEGEEVVLMKDYEGK